MNIKKKIFLTAFSIGLLHAGLANAEILRMEGTVNVDALNIRQSNDAKSNIVISAKRGTKIKVIGADENNLWLKVEYSSRSGWVDRKYVDTSVVGESNYKVVSSLGNISESGIIANGVKSTANSKYKYILDFSEKAVLKSFDKNNNFVSATNLNYSWVFTKQDQNNIVLAVDEDMNIYTNTSVKDIITKYDQKGLKLLDIPTQSLGDVSYILYNPNDQLLYSLDTLAKTIKGFNAQGAEAKSIFLSDTRIPKSFSFNKSNIYVLDYPEDEKTYYPVYYVDSLSFVLRNNYDPKAKVSESPAKGSILKNNPNTKTYKTKVFTDKDQTKTREVTWMDFSDTVKKFGTTEELKRVDAIGEIDIYRLSGEFSSTVSLNNNWTIKSPDRHRSNDAPNLLRSLKGVVSGSNSSIIIPVLTSSKTTGFSSLNYYYMNVSDNSYKVSQPIPFDVSQPINYFYDNNSLYTSTAQGSMISIDDNGIEKEKLGTLSPAKFNLATKVSFENNQLNIFDRANFSIGNYDLNGEPIKVIYKEQKSDLFNYDDVFFAKDKTVMLKSISVEDKKLGIDVLDNKLNRIFDKWLITLDSDSPQPKVAMNNKGDVIIFAKGSYYNKKTTISMFNNKGHLVNNWPKEADLLNIYTETERKLIKNNSVKFLGFDKNADIYLLISLRTGQYQIQKVRVNQEGRGEVLKIFDPNFFGESVTVENGKEKITKRQFEGTITDEVLDIEEGKQGFTYFMVRDSLTRQVRLGIFDSISNFWKEVPLSNYPNVTSFSLDNQDNIWLTQGTSIRKLANYN